MSPAQLWRPDPQLDVLDAAEGMLGQYKASRWRKPVVDIIVSDASARTVALPWQEQVSSGAQMRSYARALLESRNAIGGDAWTVNAGFRHFRHAGLGVALPTALLVRLQDRLSPQGMRLRRVLPLSAVAYWQAGMKRIHGQAILFMEEGTRTTALIYRAGRFHAIDAQPLLADAAGAAERLCKRIEALHGKTDAVMIWSLHDVQLFSDSIKRFFPQVTLSEV
ncbi:MAG: hypothetical protein ABW202_01430, partial [Duganella sp.]